MKSLLAVSDLSLTWSDDERTELKSRTMWRETSQALAERARIVLDMRRGWSEQGSDGRAGPGPADRRQAAAFLWSGGLHAALRSVAHD